jgi:hypothetical protein
MTVAELIESLQKLDPNMKVTLSIRDPQDSAYTDAVSVEPDGSLVGWVASDNEEAFAPWSFSEDDCRLVFGR